MSNRHWQDPRNLGAPFLASFARSGAFQLTSRSEDEPSPRKSCSLCVENFCQTRYHVHLRPDFLLTGAEQRRCTPGDGRILIGGVFSKAHASGSLEYWGVCNSKEFYPDFPKLKKTPGQDGPAVELLQAMFSADPYMRVSRDADGKIRMVEEDVPSDLLDVKISHLRFPAEYHGPNIAVIAIMKTPEVMAFRREDNIGPDVDWGGGGPGFGFPSDAFAPSKPSVIGDLHDVTVKEALDYVLLTFHGFWFYENCKSPAGGRTVLLGFFENVPDAAPVQTQK